MGKPMYVLILGTKDLFFLLKMYRNNVNYSQEVKNNTINPTDFQHCLLHYLQALYSRLYTNWFLRYETSTNSFAIIWEFVKKC